MFCKKVKQWRSMISISDGPLTMCVDVHGWNVKCGVRFCSPMVWGVHWLSVFPARSSSTHVMGNIYLPHLKQSDVEKCWAMVFNKAILCYMKADVMPMVSYAIIFKNKSYGFSKSTESEILAMLAKIRVVQKTNTFVILQIEAWNDYHRAPVGLGRGDINFKLQFAVWRKC